MHLTTSANGLLGIERDDVDARHHDVGGGPVVHLEDIADQHPLVRRIRGSGSSAAGSAIISSIVSRRLAPLRGADQPKKLRSREGPLVLGMWARLAVAAAARGRSWLNGSGFRRLR